MVTATHPSGIKPAGYQQLAVSSTAVALTVPAGAQRAVIGVQAQPVRWRDDGVNPDADTGMLQKADTFFELYGPQSLKAFRVIKDDSTDSVLNIVYYA